MSCVVHFECGKTTANIGVDAAVDRYLLEDCTTIGPVGHGDRPCRRQCGMHLSASQHAARKGNRIMIAIARHPGGKPRPCQKKGAPQHRKNFWKHLHAANLTDEVSAHAHPHAHTRTRMRIRARARSCARARPQTTAFWLLEQSLSRRVVGH